MLLGATLLALAPMPTVFCATPDQPQASPPPANVRPDERSRDGDWRYQMGPGMMGGYYGGGPGMMGGYGGGSGMMGGYYGGGRGMMGGYYGGGRGPGGMMGGHCDWVAGELDLTRDQETKLNRICDDLRKKDWELAGRMMTESERLRDLNNADKRDPAAIGQQYAKVQAIWRQMLEQSIDAENRIAALLTPQQAERYRQLRRWGD